jgi:hypothetical protein
VEKAVVEISQNNAEYAVPEWSVLEDDVVKEFTDRYSTSFTDTTPCETTVNRPVYFKKYETETHTDST